MKKRSKSLVGLGVISAVAASLCCITPVLALLSGASGVASAFSWIEPARPYFIGLTILVLGFAWYQKLKPAKANEVNCDCDTQKKTPFMQTKGFLGLATVFAALMLAFPLYSHVFYPAHPYKEALNVNGNQITNVAFDIQGMTCNACASHIENDVSNLTGVLNVQASYEDGAAKVQYDSSKVKLLQIEEAINATGYSVTGKRLIF